MTSSGGRVQLSHTVTAVCRDALDLAKRRRHKFIGTEHVLYFLLKDSQPVWDFISATFDTPPERIVEVLEADENFQAWVDGEATAHTDAPDYSASLIATLATAAGMGREAYGVYEATSELLFAAMLLHSPNTASFMVCSVLGRNAPHIQRSLFLHLNISNRIIDAADVIHTEETAQAAALRDGAEWNLPGVTITTEMELVCRAARHEANRRNHALICSEHVLYVMLRGDRDFKILRWLERRAGINLDAVQERLQNLPFFAAHHGRLESLPEASPRVLRLFQMAQDYVAPFLQQSGGGGAVSTEGFVATVLLEGSSAAAEVLEGAAGYGQIPKGDLLLSLGINDPDALVEALRPHASAVPWGVVKLVCPRSSRDAAAGPQRRDVSRVMPADFFGFAGPTERSNWLVPGSIIMGACPHSAAEVEVILSQSGVSTFVCLIGEWNVGYYERTAYPNAIAGLIDSGKVRRSVDCVLFPIDDYRGAGDRSLAFLVEDILERAASGEIIYLHCLSGHGRTATIASAIVQSLYRVGPAVAAGYVRSCHRERQYCGRWNCHMLEEPEAELGAPYHRETRQRSWDLHRDESQADHFYKHS